MNYPSSSAFALVSSKKYEDRKTLRFASKWIYELDTRRGYAMMLVWVIGDITNYTNVTRIGYALSQHLSTQMTNDKWPRTPVTAVDCCSIERVRDRWHVSGVRSNTRFQ